MSFMREMDHLPDHNGYLHFQEILLALGANAVQVDLPDNLEVTKKLAEQKNRSFMRAGVNDIAPSGFSASEINAARSLQNAIAYKKVRDSINTLECHEDVKKQMRVQAT